VQASGKNMTTQRIDTLRSLVASVGARQIEYHKFFPTFADQLVVDLGNYLSSPDDVALCCATGPFDFDKGSYYHEGLGFEDGRYRIPLMIRIRNLNDDGALDVRIKIGFTKADNGLTAQLAGEPVLELNLATLSPLHDYIYDYLCRLFSQNAWFNLGTEDYQSTRVGFVKR
jgi:hypothetical protein